MLLNFKSSDFHFFIYLALNFNLCTILYNYDYELQFFTIMITSYNSFDNYDYKLPLYWLVMIYICTDWLCTIMNYILLIGYDYYYKLYFDYICITYALLGAYTLMIILLSVAIREAFAVLSQLLRGPISICSPVFRWWWMNWIVWPITYSLDFACCVSW